MCTPLAVYIIILRSRCLIRGRWCLLQSIKYRNLQHNRAENGDKRLLRRGTPKLMFSRHLRARGSSKQSHRKRNGMHVRCHFHRVGWAERDLWDQAAFHTRVEPEFVFETPANILTKSMSPQKRQFLGWERNEQPVYHWVVMRSNGFCRMVWQTAVSRFQAFSPIKPRSKNVER